MDVTTDEYRSDVDALFERHTEDYPVVTEAIDFSAFTERAATYRQTTVLSSRKQIGCGERGTRVL